MSQSDASAILFSGGSDSLALLAMSYLGNQHNVPASQDIHLLCMQNGMSRFPAFPRTRFQTAMDLLSSQIPDPARANVTMAELDMGRLFQGLWLDHFELLMPKYNGKNLVCVACKLAMHTRAILYCRTGGISRLMAGYTKKQNYYPEQTQTFMSAMAALSESFGIHTTYPVYEEFENETASRHYLEDQGLPSTGGGERKCLFSQTYTSATEADTAAYLHDMIPRITDYIHHRLNGRIRETADCFRPGRIRGDLIS